MSMVRRPFRVFPALGLTALLCGAPPQQEGRVQRPMPSPAMGSGFTPRMGGGFQPEGRVSRPSPGRGEASGPRDIAPAGRTPGARSTLVYYPGTRTLVPPMFWERCTILPDAAYWHRRDIQAEIQRMARSGFIPVTPLGTGVNSLSDFVQYPAGWRAYGMAVPAGGRVQFELNHANLGWFRLMLVNKWGEPGPGMLQAAIAPQPVLVTYTNPSKEATAVYVIVDDPGWWSTVRDPYTLTVRRSWDPMKTDLSQVQLVAGLWGASPSVSAEFRGPSLSGPAVFPH